MSGFMALLDQRRPSVSDAESFVSCNGRESKNSSLVDLCRNILVSNLERYPPEAFAILNEDEWENIIRVRYNRTRPQKGKGGLDGRGRRNPAVSEKFMLELEKATPHLAQSTVIDKLVWKDIVEFRFKVGGVSRPKGLLYPWPVLESLAEEYANNLTHISKMDVLDKETQKVGFRTIKEICEMPVDVLLLQSSGIGKTVKKFMKACTSNQCLKVFREPFSSSSIGETPFTKLGALLRSWMAMAASSGVKMKASLYEDSPVDTVCSKDLAKARKCKSWRELFDALNEYDEKRRSEQAARMRECRLRLDSVRPKIVKVRHACSRQSNILDRKGSCDALSPARQKIQQLRVEASVTALRRSYPRSSPARQIPKVVGGFGDAVAFATRGRGSKRKYELAKRTTLVELGGQKRMKIPDRTKAAENIKRLAKKGGFSFG